MGNKIVNIVDDTITFDADLIIKHLNKVPTDISVEYVKSIDMYVESLLKHRSLITLKENETILRYVLSGMNQEQLDKFGQLVMYLCAKDPVAEVEKILKLVFEVEVPTPEVKQKAADLIERILSSDHDLKSKYTEIMTYSEHLRTLGQSMIMLSFGKEFRGVAMESLYIQENVLDALVEIANNKLELKIE